MRNMFDDFMDELRRRQAEQEGKTVEPQDESASEPTDGNGSTTSHPSLAAGSQEDDQVNSDGSDSGNGSNQDDDDRGIFGGGGWSGRPRGPRSVNTDGDMPQIHIGRFWIVLAIILVVVLPLLTAFFTLGVGIWTDAIWYQSVGFANVFWTRFASQVGYFAAGGAFAFVFLWFNIWLSGRLIPKGQLRHFSLDDFLDRFNVDRYTGGGFGNSPFGSPPRRPVAKSAAIEVPDVGRPVFWSLVVLSVLVALGLGALMTSNWTTIQLFIHRAAFGQTDPTFSKDIGFYIFELPFYRLLQGYANTLLLLSLVVIGIRYAVAVISGASMPTAARSHIGVLVMLLLFSIAIGFQLDRYGLVYSNQSGIFQGASYADVNAKFTAINIMTVLAAFAGTLFLVFCFTRWWAPLTATIVIWIGAYVILGVAYPQLVQRLAVDPNQQGQESPYLQNNIDMTRLGFGINSWVASPYQPGSSVTQASLDGAQATVQNLRLWDYRPLGPILSNSQSIRQYYSFADVDTDRYVFTDAQTCSPNPAPCVRQVMLAGRELDPSKVSDLNNGNSSWVNQHLVYTHGIGLAMLPVNEIVITQQSQSAPRLVIQDLPPVSAPGAPTVKEPRIYFGTQASDWVVVGGSTKEFDYQSSDAAGEQKNTWTGTTGIKMDTTLTKLLFAARFGDLNLLISNQVSGDSQLLFRRSIQERVQEIAPYLRYDQDPYLVVGADGRLSYVLDAFTTSDAFPDANLYDPSSDNTANRLDGSPFNYVRNSVKVVMDAYDGTTTFYVADPTDPIIQAWEGVFPGVYHPLSELSADMRAHLRYPESQFNAQTTMYEKYHVTDPILFYGSGDVWQVARNGGSKTNGLEQLPLEAYYVEMQVPGQSQAGSPEFLLLQPMTPKDRPNMIAWVAARNDPANYGKVDVFNFPGSSTIFGPVQMQSLIAANKDISPSLTLWSTQGSTVTLGNLLVVPLQGSILYVEPVYVQSASNPYPVLQKVIVASPGHVVWGDTLESALNQLVSGGGASPGTTPTPGSTATPGSTPTISPTATPGGSPTAIPSPISGNAQQLIAAASQHYDAAQAALRSGDLATYQKEMDTVGQILKQLQGILGTPAP
jgi:uncharacterized membrane protein (UPF0182 family)